MIHYIIAAGIGAFLGSRSKKSKKSYAHGGEVESTKKGFDKLLRESRETDDLPMVEAFVDGEWITVASDDIQGVHTFDGKDYHLFTNDFDGKDIVEKGKDYPFTFSSKSAMKKAFKHRITKMKKVGSTYAEGGGVNDVDFQEWKKATISNRAKILGRVSEMRQAEGGVKYYKGIGYDVSEIEEALNPFSAINENNTYAKGGYVMGDYNDTLPNGITLTDIRMENEGVEVTGQEFQLFDTETGETEYLDNEDDLFDKYDGERYDAKTVWYYTYDGEDLRYEERYDGYAKGGKTRKKRKK